MKRRWTVIFEVVLLIAVVAGVVYMLYEPRASDRIKVKIHLRATREDAALVKELKDGKVDFHYEVKREDGTVENLSPDELARQTFTDQRKGAWWMRLLNISSPFGVLWVGVGLMGQVLFTGRMVVQWIASEKEKKSTVPTAFWWMSLIGASMLMIYFMWRRDAVGILGQGVGWFVYVRNLWMIYHPHKGQAGPSVADDPGPEPELPEKG